MRLLAFSAHTADFCSRAGVMRRNMEKLLRNAVLLVSALLGVAFLVFLVNQTVQVVGLADRLHPALGTAVLWGLLLIYVGCAFVPLAMLLRLPRPLTPPTSEATPEFPAQTSRKRSGSWMDGRTRSCAVSVRRSSSPPRSRRTAAWMG